MTRYGQCDAEDLLPLALSRPQEALASANALIATGPGPYEASIAHQAAGIVYRDFGDIGIGLRELRTGLRFARAAGSPDREADLLATLGATLVAAGRTAAGLSTLDQAARLAGGALAGRILMRRGFALQTLGRYDEALAAFRRAVGILRRSGDTVWEARALTQRALIELTYGAAERAAAGIDLAERLFTAAGQELESAYAVHNRALVAFRSGDLPVALTHLDEAARRYRTLQASVPDLVIDRCAVLLMAGLAVEAAEEADAGLGDLRRIRGSATKRAELLLTAGSSALAAADPQTALARAQAAHRLFGAQRRTWWHAHAELVILQARFLIGGASGRLLGQARRSAERLAAIGSPESTHAHLLAGRMALALRRAPDAERHLGAAARSRRRGPPLSRAEAWLAEALRAEQAADRRGVLRACARGLDVLDTHALTLGAAELRARAGAHGAELAALAQRHALQSRSPRLLLRWSERWRANALAAPPVRPPDDDELRAELTAVRNVTTRLERARADGASIVVLVREQRRLEEAVRARMLRVRNTGISPGGFDIDAMLGALDSGTLVQIVDVDGGLQVLTCAGGRVRHTAAGRTEDAASELEFARFGLKRLARSRPGGEAAFPAILQETGRRLERALLGTAVRHLGDGPVVVVPPGPLHAVPWSLLPSLHDRAVSVAPSARAWLRARAAEPPADRTVVLVRGPGLRSAGAEVTMLAAAHGDATVIDGGKATAEHVLDAVDGAWLAHIAAHGTFRSDNPHFSALLMDDGPLTVYDFKRLRRAPYRLILPSCDSGLLASVGQDELLGLAATMLPLGTASIVAALVPVNDAAVVPVMTELHRWLLRGAAPAEALLQVRRTVAADPALRAAASSFIALGAG